LLFRGNNPYALSLSPKNRKTWQQRQVFSPA